MKKLIAIFGAVILVLLLAVLMHKKKHFSEKEIAAASAAAERVNSQLPIQLGITLLVTKASIVENHAEISYLASWPSKVKLDSHMTASLRGSMVQFACGNAAAREIMTMGFDIHHRALAGDGQEMFATVSDLGACLNR